MLLFGPPDGAKPRGAWEASASGAWHGAIEPVLTSPALVPAAVFAIFAVALPIVVRGRSLVLDSIGATAWAAGLAATLGAMSFLPHPRGGVAGAALGAALVVAAGETGLLPLPGRRQPLP
jgi:hypothetical protein